MNMINDRINTLLNGQKLATESIIEIFSSIQGEGKYVGYRQAFLRFEGCNLSCDYCDTEHRVGSHRYCRVELNPGSHRQLEIPNPLTPAAVAEYVNNFADITPHQALSLTGGEPLLHTKFITELAPLVRLPLLLETNGTLGPRLKRVLPLISIISMDIKLPSMVGQELWGEHGVFMEIAREKDLYVKLVIERESSTSEISKAISLIASVDRSIPLILQPVTPHGHCKAPSADLMLKAQEMALGPLRDVRVIPQTHVMMGQR